MTRCVSHHPDVVQLRYEPAKDGSRDTIAYCAKCGVYYGRVKNPQKTAANKSKPSKRKAGK